jgi:uncharacterized integral membrane protein
VNGCGSALDWRLIGAIAAGLFFFGLSYNALMHALGERKDGYTALFVVGGVLVTLTGLALIDWRCALLALTLFVASGLPMVIGDMYRSIKKKDAILAALREGMTTETQRHGE